LKYLEILGFLKGFNPFLNPFWDFYHGTNTPKPTQRKKVVRGEVSVRLCSPERGALKGMIPRVFPNLRRKHKYKNLPLPKQLSFYLLPSFSFHKKEILPWERGNI
jgi:hypothetical protein